MSGAGAPGATAFDAHQLTLALVATRWHAEITGALLDSAQRAAAECGITEPTVLRVAGALLQLAFHLLRTALDLLAGATRCLSNLALHLACDVLDGTLDLVLVHGTLHCNERNCPQAPYDFHSRVSDSFGALKRL